jgi:type II secretory pathway component PulJ
MFIKSSQSGRNAWTLMEMLLGVAIFAVSGMALSSIYIFSLRSFAALTNYSSLDRENRYAMDLLTREIRQAKQVTSYGTNGTSTLTIINGDTQTVTYSFSPTTKQMLRQVHGGETQVLLTNCDLLNFSLYQRNPSNGNYGIFPTATNNWQQTVKVIQFTWKTASSLPNAEVNSENVQTARVVIRKQTDD